MTISRTLSANENWRWRPVQATEKLLQSAQVSAKVVPHRKPSAVEGFTWLPDEFGDGVDCVTSLHDFPDYPIYFTGNGHLPWPVGWSSTREA